MISLLQLVGQVFADQQVLKNFELGVLFFFHDAFDTETAVNPADRILTLEAAVATQIVIYTEFTLQLLFHIGYISL